MHPILAQRGRLGLYLGAWVPVIGLISTLLVLSGRLPWSHAIVLAIPLGFLNAFLGLAAWYLCRTFPLQKTGVLRLFGVYAVASLLTSSLWVFFGRGIAAALSVLSPLHELNVLYPLQVPLLFGVGILLFLLVAVVHYLLSSFETSRSSERKALELQILAREAELKSLRAQIDPHFLFNCLNSISALTNADPAKARRMCLLLADFLRMSLELGNRAFISLEEEISLAAQFLAIEQVRLGGRLLVDKNIQESARDCMIPPLLLQPLVENAVRHGVAQLLEGGSVRIETEKRGDRLRIVVENPYDADSAPESGKGIGLENVRRRLATLFGAEAQINLHSGNGIFRVEISFPWAPSGGSGKPAADIASASV